VAAAHGPLPAAAAVSVEGPDYDVAHQVEELDLPDGQAPGRRIWRLMPWQECQAQVLRLFSLLPQSPLQYYAGER